MSFVPSTFFISIAAFLVLYWLLRKYAFDSLFGILESRKKHVLEQMQSADNSRKQAEQLLEEQKLAIQQAKKDAYDIIEQSRTASSKQSEDILNDAKAEAGRIKEEALRDIESEKNKAIAALRSQVSGMSVMIASKIIEKQLDEKSQEQIIAKYLEEVGGNV